MGLINKLEAIAEAIRNKTNTTNKLTLDEMPALIESISGGGMVKEKPYINFYGFGGTLLHSYFLEDFNTLSSLPRVPDNIAGYKAIGWNKDIDTIKASGHHEDVGAIYEKLPNDVVIEENEEVNITDTTLFLHFEYSLNISIYFRQSKANAVTVNWGDGTSDTSPSSYGNTNITMSHTYDSGDYELTFTVEEGQTLSLGTYSTSTGILGSTSINQTQTQKLAVLRKAWISTKDTVLTDGVFRYLPCLKEVLISDDKSNNIPRYAFEFSYALTHVRLSNQTKLIYDYAFRSCYSLERVVIPEFVTSIGAYAFTDCRSLRRIVIPPSVKTISSQAFQSCFAMKYAYLNEGVETLGSNVFSGCIHLDEVYLPSTLKSCSSYLFNGCFSLKKIGWPKRLTTIYSYTFANCYSLKEVILPEGVVSIQSNAFNNCYALRYIGFPKSLKSIYDNAFSGTNSLKVISFNQGFETLGSLVFANNYSLKRIILPESLKSFGLRTFQNVKALEVLEVPEKHKPTPGLLTLSAFKDNSFALYEKEKLENLTSLKDAAFEYSCAFKDLEIPDAITSINPYAFRYNYCLEKLTLPLNLTTIGSYAFSYCISLADFVFPKLLSVINSYAFEFNQAIQKLSFPSYLQKIEASAFSNNYSLEEVEFGSNGLILNGQVFSSCYSLKKVSFKTGVTSITIGSSTFYYTALENLSFLPMHVKLNGTGTFQYCYCLREADISNFEGAGSYYNSMFYYDYSLKSVTLPKKLEAIGSSMFQYCYALESIEIPEEVTVINSNAFYDCRSLTDVIFKGNKLTTINSGAFQNCMSLKHIYLPYSMKIIQSCFNGCYSLHDVYFYSIKPPTGVTSIGTMAEGYVIHVPKGSLSLYEAQFSGHKGHFVEFYFIIAMEETYTKKLGRSYNSLTLRNFLVASEFGEDANFIISTQYEGNNIASIDSISLDEEKNMLLSFTRNEEVTYNITEDMTITIEEETTGTSTQINLSLFFMDNDILCEYSVSNPAGYEFVYNEDDDYYYSSNTGIHNSYSLAKVTFVTNTGKLYVDCTGQGESNCDFGIVSNLDTVLTSSNATDNATAVKKSFAGLGTYSQTVEFDIDDENEHFIYIKYRKDGSVNTGSDNLKFRIRFEE